MGTTFTLPVDRKSTTSLWFEKNFFITSGKFCQLVNFQRKLTTVCNRCYFFFFVWDIVVLRQFCCGINCIRRTNQGCTPTDILWLRIINLQAFARFLRSSFSISDTHVKFSSFLSEIVLLTYVSVVRILFCIRSRVQKFPAWHTKAAPNGKCCEGYIVPSMVRLMYQLESVLK